MFSCGLALGVAAVQLAVADHALRLGADVDQDLVLVDADHVALDHVAVLEAADLGRLLGEQLLHGGRLGAGVHEGSRRGLLFLDRGGRGGSSSVAHGGAGRRVVPRSDASSSRPLRLGGIGARSGSAASARLRVELRWLGLASSAVRLGGRLGGGLRLGSAASRFAAAGRARPAAAAAASTGSTVARGARRPLSARRLSSSARLRPSKRRRRRLAADAQLSGSACPASPFERFSVSGGRRGGVCLLRRGGGLGLDALCGV